MIDEKDLFNYKKECLLHALQRNLQAGERSSELQAKKWCIAYWLIYVGFFVKERNLIVTWLEVGVGLLGIAFFLAWELVAHYYFELVTRHRFTLNRYSAALPKMTFQELLEFEPLSTSPQSTLTRKDKLILALSTLSHETLLFFYGGLAIFMLVVLLLVRYGH
jgi:hypothetical protein